MVHGFILPNSPASFFFICYIYCLSFIVVLLHLKKVNVNVNIVMMLQCLTRIDMKRNVSIFQLQTWIFFFFGRDLSIHCFSRKSTSVFVHKAPDDEIQHLPTTKMWPGKFSSLSCSSMCLNLAGLSGTVPHNFRQQIFSYMMEVILSTTDTDKFQFIHLNLMLLM